MHIVINSLSAKRGGGQTYIENLVNNLEKKNNLKITILLFEGQNVSFSNNQIEIIKFSNHYKNPIILIIWELFFIKSFLNQLKTDIYFCPGGLISASLKSTDFKKVTMFRNMIPFDEYQKKKWPLGYMRIRNKLLSILLLNSMEIADLVIFISKYGKEVIINELKGNIKNYVLINHGVSKIFREKYIEPPASIKNLFNEDYILYPSIIDVYKSQKEVIESYNILNKKKINLPKLILVGQKYGDYSKKIDDLIIEYKLSNKIFVTGEILHKYMPYIYRNAKFMIYASQSENCPNILLEGLASAKAIICSNFLPMKEFAGNSVIYFDPRSSIELASKIEKLLVDQHLVRKLETDSFKTSINYDWKLTADLTLSAILKLDNNA